MEIKEALHTFSSYSLWLVIIGIAIIAVSVLPRILASFPFSMPIGLLVFGYAVVALPFGLDAPDVNAQSKFAEHLTELGVIISLMGAGLKIDRPPSLKGWSVTWRLLGITMVITIALSAFIGWWFLAFAPATAMLLGAVIAPTDPVLASEVQVASPGKSAPDDEDSQRAHHKAEDELRFALTSEAGLNDGLAFPFTNMAIAMVIAGAHPAGWFGTWLSIHVLYEMAVAVIIGLGLGYLLARLLMAIPADSHIAKAMTGLGALAATLLLYGTTEFFGGYGFLATFVGAVMIRQYKPHHPLHKPMHILTEKLERILTAIILLALGAAIAGGLLAALNWKLIVCAVLIIFVVRPVAGMAGLAGSKAAPWRERLAISFLGIRGIGSLYYLAYALNQQDFAGSETLWALVALVIVISIFVHGITATPITEKLDKMRT
ncbi:MAG: cation:proton antiporter [Bacteroidia bacterium]